MRKNNKKLKNNSQKDFITSPKWCIIKTIIQSIYPHNRNKTAGLLVLYSGLAYQVRAVRYDNRIFGSLIKNY